MGSKIWLPSCISARKQIIMPASFNSTQVFLPIVSLYAVDILFSYLLKILKPCSYDESTWEIFKNANA